MGHPVRLRDCMWVAFAFKVAVVSAISQGCHRQTGDAERDGWMDGCGSAVIAASSPLGTVPSHMRSAKERFGYRQQQMLSKKAY